MSVDPTFASALKATSLLVTSTPATAAAWAEKALGSSIVSPLRYQADAQIEADSQAAFLAGPLAIDEHILPGRLHGTIGTVVTLTGDRLGYEAGAAVFVIGADETAADGTTKLTVLKRLSE